MVNSLPLEPAPREMLEMGALTLKHVVTRMEHLGRRPASNPFSAAATDQLVKSFLAPPPSRGSNLQALLTRLDEAADCALESAGPGYLSYVPGSGLFSSALAEFYNRATNRYGGVASLAPAFAALEESVIRWIATDVCALPDGSGGLLTSGGSMATFSAVVAARHSRLGEDIARGTLYITAFTHHSVAKAARLAGIPSANIRIVDHDNDLRMDPDAALAGIVADRQAGLRPFLIVATAGTTDTGTIDPLRSLGDLARREDLWYHVDAAYGGFFRMTARGRKRLDGIEAADSVTMDPHKTLYLPFGTGALVVRDVAALQAAHGGTGNYLQDLHAAEVPDSAQLGPEMTHEIRGLRAWLPLHLHGTDLFRESLDEKLSLAESVHGTLSKVADLELPLVPDLSTVVFRMRAADNSQGAVALANEASRVLLQRINADGRVVLSSTDINGRFTLRVSIVSHRTHADRVDDLLEIIAREVDQVVAGAKERGRNDTELSR
jgi:aromatic-L-amino-acid decarboxylase